jgi:hypothetical protein
LILSFLLITQSGFCQSQPETVEGIRVENSSEKKALVSFPGFRGVHQVEVQQKTFPLLLQYSSLIDLKSVVAKFNGEDISDRINPGTGREVVRLELKPGFNELVVQSKPLDQEGGMQVQRLTLVKSERPHHDHQGRMTQGEVKTTDSTKSMVELFQNLSERRKK